MTERPTHSEHTPEGHAGHEPVSVNVRGVMMWVGALLLLLIAVGVGMQQLFTALSVAPERRPAPAPRQTTEPPRTEPTLRADLSQQLKDLRAAERDRLTSYGWVDRDAGIVHIPIDRAMDLLLERGLPVREQKEDIDR